MDLFEAAKNGNIQRINELLDEGVDVNMRNVKHRGNRALMYAVVSSILPAL